MTLARVALTETNNAYKAMPETVAELSKLADFMPDIRDANIAHHIELISKAAKIGVQTLCMGELFTGPYFALGRDAMWRKLAEDAATGTTILAMCEAAKTHKMLLVAPIYELDAATGTCYNTAVVIERDGSILGKYRKCHIPEGTNDAGSFCETFYYERSNGKLDNKVIGDGGHNISNNDFFPVFKSSVGNIGVAICYDRHFPGVIKTLAENGAELIFSPAVTFGKKSQEMWEMEFPVDATRHNVFIGGSNRVGSEAPWHQEYFGQSYFVGPNGRCSALSSAKGLVVADLPLAELSSDDPSGWNFSRDLRPSIYK